MGLITKKPSIIVNVEELNGTVQSILEQMERADMNMMDVSFKIAEKGISIQTMEENTHFSVYSVEEHVHTLITGCNFLKISNKEEFAEFILNFDLEELKNFEADKEFEIRWLIDEMDGDMKDQILLSLMLQELEKKQALNK